MITLGTRELRAGLARFVQRAADGETFVVTVTGRPSAMLGPLDHPAGAAPSTLGDLARLGLVEPPSAPASGGNDDQPTDQHGARLLPADLRVDRIVRQVRG